MWCDRNVNIKEEVKRRKICRKELMEYFSTIYEKYYYRDDLSNHDLQDFDCLLNTHPAKYLYIEDELFEIIYKQQK